MRFYQVNRPLFECFAHNRVVCVSQSFAADFPRFVPDIAVVVHKDSHKFRHAERRMGIIYMDYNLIGKVIKSFIFFVMLSCNLLKRCTYKEILLLNTQRFTVVVVVSRIKNLGN